MITLDDVGKEVSVKFDVLYHNLNRRRIGPLSVSADVFVTMGIRSPKGSVFIFGKPWEDDKYCRHVKNQCEGIRSFMGVDE